MQRRTERVKAAIVLAVAAAIVGTRLCDVAAGEIRYARTGGWQRSLDRAARGADELRRVDHGAAAEWIDAALAHVPADGTIAFRADPARVDIGARLLELRLALYPRRVVDAVQFTREVSSDFDLLDTRVFGLTVETDIAPPFPECWDDVAIGNGFSLRRWRGLPR